MFFEEAALVNELNCIKCKQRLDEPRILPCGETICDYCFITIEVKNNKFKCFFCNEDHIMPEKGFPINKRLLRILDLKSKEVYRSKEVKQLKENLKLYSIQFKIDSQHLDVFFYINSKLALIL